MARRRYSKITLRTTWARSPPCGRGRVPVTWHQRRSHGCYPAVRRRLDLLGVSALLVADFLSYLGLQARQVTPGQDATPPGYTAF